jgi:cell wall-associated NlpC family hydrolase
MLNFRPGFAALTRHALSVLSLATLLTSTAMAAPSNHEEPAVATAAAEARESIRRLFSESGLAGEMRNRASEMVATAMNFLGVRYQRGGSSVESGFDCSGFTRQVFESSLGFALPRRVDEQARAAGLVAVKKNDLQPGDLVFFNTLRRTFSHVGIYVGEGKFIHSPKPGGEVRVEDMRFVYWAKRFTGARRAGPAAEQAVAGAPPAAAITPQAIAPQAIAPANTTLR